MELCEGPATYSFSILGVVFYNKVGLCISELLRDLKITGPVGDMIPLELPLFFS